ncbi:MAG TPA: DUF2141 domain-containing protein [Myxococcota bacterium]|nr:DUF2141 domain-containing protein [Myxococcota bacterium]
MAPRAILGLCLVTAFAARARAGELVVRIHGLEPGRGVVEVDLFDASKREAFPYTERGDTAELHVRVGASSEAAVSFGEVPAGRYALVVIDDANANGDLDRNALGVPTEPYGFSNGARPVFRAPTFDEAAIAVAAGAPTLTDVVLRR